MDERRKTKRSSLASRLVIKRLDGGEVEEVEIEVLDVNFSKDLS